MGEHCVSGRRGRSILALAIQAPAMGPWWNASANGYWSIAGVVFCWSRTMKPSPKAATTAALRKIQIALPATGEDEWLALREPLASRRLTQGPKGAAFERAFAERHKVARAVATTSCTTALHLALQALGVGPGDEVIVPSFTWVATANAVLHCGATPILCDVDRATYNIDVDSVTSKL